MLRPLLGVAAREAIRDTARACHRTAPVCAARYLSTFCLSGAKSLQLRRAGTRLGGVEHVEDEFGGTLPASARSSHSSSSLSASSDDSLRREDRERALLLDERHLVVLQQRREFLQHDGGFEPRLHRAAGGAELRLVGPERERGQLLRRPGR